MVELFINKEGSLYWRHVVDDFYYCIFLCDGRKYFCDVERLNLLKKCTSKDEYNRIMKLKILW